jgi:hypothetical protein
LVLVATITERYVRPMKRVVAAALGLALASLSLASGCALTCSANDQKLAQLQRGMSYDDASRVMGCPGAVVSEYTPTTGDYATVEYNGPSSLFMRTRLDFMQGRLLYFTTEPRAGL